MELSLSRTDATSQGVVLTPAGPATTAAKAALTINGEGVRIFLCAANEHREAAHQLQRMYYGRKRRETPEAQALRAGWLTTSREAEADIEKLRKRGGLLHLGCAQIDYAEGNYTVRGAA